jgi:hypothetical protein
MLKSTIKRINDYDSSYDEKTWFSIEKKLNQKRRNRILLLLFFIISLLLSSVYVYNSFKKTEPIEQEEFIPTP